MIKDLTRIHTQLDETIRHRTEQISIETESVLAQIINETQQEQQRLLQYAKERQAKQEEKYRDQLQSYISKLDDIKVREMAQLQDELQQGREQILQVSQMKIMSVNEQANIAKSKVVKDEQQQASLKINSINLQLQNLTKDKTFQQLGTESKTRTSLMASSHVGSKLPGQNCSFDYLEDMPINNESNERSNHTYKKTTYPIVSEEEKLRAYQVNQEIQKSASNTQ